VSSPYTPVIRKRQKPGAEGVAESPSIEHGTPLKLPRQRGQSHFAAFFFDCNINSNSIGLTSPMLE